MSDPALYTFSVIRLYVFVMLCFVLSWRLTIDNCGQLSPEWLMLTSDHSHKVYLSMLRPLALEIVGRLSFAEATHNESS